MRQLRLRHRQRIEAFAQQFDLASFGYQVASEQLMKRSAGGCSATLPHILGSRSDRKMEKPRSRNSQPGLVFVGELVAEK